MRLKEAVKIIQEIDEQRQALNKIGEVLEPAEGIEQHIKDLERRRNDIQSEIAAQARQEHKAAVALLEAQHAEDVGRMKKEVDGLTQEHERKMAMYDNEEKGAINRIETVRAEIKRLTEHLRQSA